MTKKNRRIMKRKLNTAGEINCQSQQEYDQYLGFAGQLKDLDIPVRATLVAAFPPTAQKKDATQ